MTAKESWESFMWEHQAIKIYLDDETILVAQADDEGNDAGALLHLDPNKTEKSSYDGKYYTSSETWPVMRENYNHLGDQKDG